MAIPPWLVPPNFLGAIQSGAQLGLQIRAQRDAENRAAAQLLRADQELMYKAQEAAANRQLQAQENAIRQQSAMEALARQQQNDLFTQNLAAARENRQEEVDFSKAARENQLFQENQDFARAVRETPLPDVTGLTPEEAQQKYAERSAFLMQNAPSSVLPQLLMKEEQDRDMQNRIRMAADLRLRNETGAGGVAEGLEKKQDIITTRQKTAIQKQAEDFANSLRESNPNLQDAQIQLAKDQFVATRGESAKAPPEIVKIVDAGDAIVQGIGDALAAIEKFNSKFGPNAFDQFTGPVEGRIQKLKSKYGNLTKEDEVAARQIWSSISQIEQAYRKANFGTALTANETEQFKNIVEDPNSTAFIPTLRSFKDTSERVIRNNLATRPFAQNFAPGIVQRYGGSTTQNTGPTRVNSQSDYDALPPRAFYIDSTGKVKQKNKK